MGLGWYPQVGSHHFAVIAGQRVHDAACALALPPANAAHFHLSACLFTYISMCCSCTAYSYIHLRAVTNSVGNKRIRGSHHKEHAFTPDVLHQGLFFCRLPILCGSGWPSDYLQEEVGAVEAHLPRQQEALTGTLPASHK